LSARLQRQESPPSLHTLSSDSCEHKYAKDTGPRLCASQSAVMLVRCVSEVAVKTRPHPPILVKGTLANDARTHAAWPLPARLNSHRHMDISRLPSPHCVSRRTQRAALSHTQCRARGAAHTCLTLWHSRLFQRRARL
jgi:hypothetical protein